ncbi:Zinc finger protein Sdr4 [Quillaja saponaria]|uniref:Zinc finger protein Sdr4 n=1 Tax=Quillaja saponaria TaxID=32244 RepID=A0AAD7LYB2_QUISA|nr:Zinc finger protein Sdr4 [Quillaja saponaria]
MIKTLNPYTDPAKTAEIMARYRPIAPKPESTSNSMSDEGSSLSEKIKQSPYLRNLWPQLQARPTRTRKRGRAPILPPSQKRQRSAHVMGFCSPCHVTSPAKNLSLQGFAPGLPQLPIPNLGAISTSLENPAATTTTLVTLPLLPCSPSVSTVTNQATCTIPQLDFLMKHVGEETIDLNTVAEIPEEKDLLQQLQGPIVSNVIAPQPIRPIGSSIRVGCINEDPSLPPMVQAPKKPEEVEEEVESETLPAVISDSNNRIRMANSAYKEMVGQPECSWLDSMVTTDGRLGGGSCRRIGGDVVLHISDSTRVPTSSNGFSCWVRIDWETDGKKSSINAFCDVIRSSCVSRDYLFTWRFHTRSREASQSSCDV